MASTTSPAKDIADYIEDAGIGTLGTNMYIHSSPAGKTFQITVRDTGGFDPEAYIDVSDKIRRPTVQVVIRGAKYNFADAYLAARNIIDLIDQKYNVSINGKRYIRMDLSGDIIDTGEDTNECPVLSVNFALQYAIE